MYSVSNKLAECMYFYTSKNIKTIRFLSPGTPMRMSPYKPKINFEPQFGLDIVGFKES